MTGRTNAAGGVRLPELTNPAGAAQILSGYEAINADGEAVTGTLVVKEPVYGIYNDPAQYVEFSNDDYSLNYLKITLPTPIEKVLGLNVMYFYNGLRAVMCYPATDSGSNEDPYPSEADDAAVWDVAAEAISGQVFVPVGEGKLSVSGSTITLTSKNQSTSTLNKIDSVYQVAYTYIPA